MKDETLELKGYIDPRTGEYVRTKEDASPEEVAEVIGFIQGWKFYWDGPVHAHMDEEAKTTFQTPAYERETWLASDERKRWLEMLTEEQRKMLEDSFPPEEVPQLERANDS